MLHVYVNHSSLKGLATMGALKASLNANFRRFYLLLVVSTMMFSMGGIPGFAKGRGHLGSLVGSGESLDRQQRAARLAQLKLHRDRREVSDSINAQKLIRVRADRYLELANVSYPYAHPKLASLLRSLSRLYWRHCRVPLVVTSLMRPLKEQPRNASKRSVHPAGIAADLRVPPYQCRAWLRETLSSWERLGFIEATREKRPPHFHVVAIPTQLTNEVIADLEGRERSVKTDTSIVQRPREEKHTQLTKRSHGAKRSKHYRVRRGDSLWSLSRKWGVTQSSIKRLNRLRSNRIDLGQVLVIP